MYPTVQVYTNSATTRSNLAAVQFNFIYLIINQFDITFAWQIIVTVVKQWVALMTAMRLTHDATRQFCKRPKWAQKKKILWWSRERKISQSGCWVVPNKKVSWQLDHWSHSHSGFWKEFLCEKLRIYLKKRQQHEKSATHIPCAGLLNFISFCKLLKNRKKASNTFFWNFLCVTRSCFLPPSKAVKDTIEAIKQGRAGNIKIEFFAHPTGSSWELYWFT